MKKLFLVANFPMRAAFIHSFESCSLLKCNFKLIVNQKLILFIFLLFTRKLTWKAPTTSNIDLKDCKSWY